MLEIERKFLVKSECYKEQISGKYKIVQGYLSVATDRSVRVRLCKDKGFLTIKGANSESGRSRFEWEKEISLKEARALMSLCLPNKIEKIRHCIKFGKHLFAVDQFSGKNTGLTIAEIELKSEDEAFEKPEWLGKEVTSEKKYYNSQLCQKPYLEW